MIGEPENVSPVMLGTDSVQQSLIVVVSKDSISQVARFDSPTAGMEAASDISRGGERSGQETCH